ncbi:hypothetical protein CHS0354_026985 [Potamilus streckersoni]|uniref:Uncharacterized protein n=1 Tax=Potamilus streckersoni TaxID=2493646 RepID=A0AAE0SC48_9BIVA|nr:hypothetical protein CHS0354_026985 [Potamilus streckersoni]
MQGNPLKYYKSYLASLPSDEMKKQDWADFVYKDTGIQHTGSCGRSKEVNSAKSLQQQHPLTDKAKDHLGLWLGTADELVYSMETLFGQVDILIVNEGFIATVNNEVQRQSLRGSSIVAMKTRYSLVESMNDAGYARISAPQTPSLTRVITSRRTSYRSRLQLQ